jgi:hypothetical protein
VQTLLSLETCANVTFVNDMNTTFEQYETVFCFSKSGSTYVTKQNSHNVILHLNIIQTRFMHSEYDFRISLAGLKTNAFTISL